MEKSIRTFSQKAFHEGHIARALFLLSRALERLGKPSESLVQLAEANMRLTQAMADNGHPIKLDELMEKDFDKLICLQKR